MQKPTTRSGLDLLERALQDSSLSRAEYIRVQSVLMKKKGYRLRQIMGITGKAQVTIQGWITDYNHGGIDALRTKKREEPGHALLSKGDKDEIKQLITGHKPQEYGYTGDFWSVPTLKQLVKDRFKVGYETAKAYRDLFAYCGYSYQKAEFVDRRREKGAQGDFKKRFERKVKKGVISMWW